MLGGEKMACINCNCTCKCICNIIAIVASIVVGVVTAFLQISGIILITDAFLWVVLGIAVGFLAVLLASSSLARAAGCRCICSALGTILVGILGAALFSIVLLGVGVVATSVVSAILAGLVLAFLALTLSGSACFVKSLAGCCNE